MSSPKVLALRQNGFVAHYWHFNLAELIFQVMGNLGYCYVFFVLNMRQGSPFAKVRHKKWYILLVLFNILFMFIFCLGAGIIQRHLFTNGQLKGIFWSGYLTRFFLSSLLAAIIVKIILLLRESKQKDSENEQLKTAYLEAELELLKEQLNPHFLFNSLSTLSGIVREDPQKAQVFINHLSKIFRYALAESGNQMATVADELKMIASYGQLLDMRFERAFQLKTDVGEKYLPVKIPHLSLQPLIENAAKHNSATIAKPLIVSVFIADDKLTISNNLQQIYEPENSNGIGLVNLNSRFRILMHKEIEIEKTRDTFTVKLPLV